MPKTNCQETKSKTLDGVLRCSRYAFGPNRLHYCGPDSNQEIKAHIEEGQTDPALEHLLSQFKTMYPYLRFIADENKIADAFDSRVVEAYWLGNKVLENVSIRHFFRHLIETQQIKKHISQKEFAHLEKKIAIHPLPHHSFHVMNIWRRTGHTELAHTFESLDECRISSGRVLEADGPSITVLTEPLLYLNGKLIFGTPIRKKLARRLESEYDIEQIRPGDIVSIHWSIPCEVITPLQEEMLKKYTSYHLELANQTL